MGDGELTATNTTVTNNRADLDGDGTGTGGGLFVSQDVTVTLNNTLVAGNFIGTESVSSDIEGSAAGAHNLIGTGGSGGLLSGVDGNLVGISDSKLGPLADNGGPTQTHALLSGSPAIDRGDNALASGLTDDQRGAGFPRILGPRVDVGAFEFADTTAPVVIENSFVFDAVPQALRIRFSEAIDALLLPGALGVVNLATLNPVPVEPLTYDSAANAATFPMGALADGNYRATLKAENVKDAAGNPLATDLVFDFFVLTADANRDRTIDFDDLAILAQSYNTTGKSFAQGNFD